MDIYKTLDSAIASLAGFLWGTPLVVLLLGGGIFFAAYSRMVPILYFKHGIDILLGKYDSDDDPGQITHFEALSSALAGTVGMGNIAGVAVAIHAGGPGAVFWMWVTAILGMSTKFFTCSLALMYRGKDDQGEIQGGVMYYIEEGLGRSYRPLAMMFSISGLLGCIVFFQANQLSQIIRDYFYVPMQIFQDDPYMGNLMTGIIVATVVGTGIFGGIKRIAKVASRMVPTMVGFYIIAAILILINNINDVPGILMLIMKDAFTGNAVSGGALGSMIIIGVRRGMFSNEAGTGTETMAHGGGKTTDPIREGLVAMLCPFIDTLVVCSITAIIILLSGVYVEDLNGVSMTAEAFKRELGIPGQIFLTIAVLNFALSTMFGYSYYGQKCASYVFGTRWKDVYNWFYVVMIVVASVASIDIAVNFVDSAYALMVIPTMTATFLLSPKVLAEAKRYFSSI